MCNLTEEFMVNLRLKILSFKQFIDLLLIQLGNSRQTLIQLLKKHTKQLK